MPKSTQSLLALRRLAFLETKNVGYADKTELAGSSHFKALEISNEIRPARVLDIGSGQAHVARKLAASGIATDVLDKAPLGNAGGETFTVDLETAYADDLPSDQYGLVLLLDVLEHFSDPAAQLRKLSNRFSSAQFLISVPNIAFIEMRLKLLCGLFDYKHSGILDQSHRYFFTLKTYRDLLDECGLETVRFHPVPPPIGLLIPGPLGRLASSFAARLAPLFPTLFAYQFMVLARPK